MQLMPQALQAALSASRMAAARLSLSLKSWSTGRRPSSALVLVRHNCVRENSGSSTCSQGWGVRWARSGGGVGHLIAGLVGVCDAEEKDSINVDRHII